MFLTGGARDLPERQQTIRNTIDWSYQLLDDAEKALFARLGVFVGGCTIEAAEAVLRTEVRGLSEGTIDSVLSSQPSVLDTLAALVDKSLLRQEEGVDGEPRFTMLETMRAYALERLEASGEAETMRRRHTAYYLGFAEAAESQLYDPEQPRWLDRLEAERDNFRTVLIWSQTNGDDVTGLRLAATLVILRGHRAYYSEVRAWLERFLAGSSNATTAVRAKALQRLGELLFRQNGATAAHAIWCESLTLFRALDDQSGIAEILNLLGWSLFHQGDLVSARTYFTDSLAYFRSLENQRGVAWALNGLAATILDPVEAQARIEESLRLSRAVGDMSTIASVLNSLGDNARERGDIVQAMACFEESLAIYRKLDSHGGITMVLTNLGYVAYHQHDRQAMVARFVEGLSLSNKVGEKMSIAISLGGLGGAASLEGQFERAALLFGASDALLDTIGEVRDVTDGADHNHMVATARAQLDEASFAAAWAAGRALTLDEAIAEALRDS